MSAKPESDTFDPFIERIAERVAAVMAKTPAKVFEAEMARRLAASLHEDATVKSLTQFGVGHNRGPPLDEEEAAVFDVPGFCRWAKISRSNSLSNVGGGHRAEVVQGRDGRQNLTPRGSRVAPGARSRRYV